MKKEYLVVLILGLFLFAYLLDAVVDPLAADLATPYQYLTPSSLATYPFTSASLLLKAAGLIIIPLLFLSFFQKMYLLKAVSLLVLSALYQLYALQQVATNAETIPLEWSLSLTLAGMLLLIPMVVFLFMGLLSGAHTKLAGTDDEESDTDFFPDEDEDEPLEPIQSEEEQSEEEKPSAAKAKEGKEKSKKPAEDKDTEGGEEDEE